jgi:hypothetical protein
MGNKQPREPNPDEVLEENRRKMMKAIKEKRSNSDSLVSHITSPRTVFDQDDASYTLTFSNIITIYNPLDYLIRFRYVQLPSAKILQKKGFNFDIGVDQAKIRLGVDKLWKILDTKPDWIGSFFIPIAKNIGSNKERVFRLIRGKSNTLDVYGEFYKIDDSGNEIYITNCVLPNKTYYTIKEIDFENPIQTQSFFEKLEKLAPPGQLYQGYSTNESYSLKRSN